MKTVLYKIRDKVSNHVRIISQAMKVDVEVVDKNLETIATSFPYDFQKDSGTRIIGNVYKKVLETGSHIIIQNPGFHFICEKCIKKGNCEELYEMGMPIIVNNDVIGVIGFVCYEEVQRSNVINQFPLYFEFLKQISEMIASEVYEEVEKSHRLRIINTLKSVINKVDEGVIILNQLNEVTRMNSVAERILAKTFHRVKSQTAIIKRVESTVDSKEEYEMVLDGKTFSVLGKYYDMEFNSEDSFKVFIFVDIFTFKNRLMAYTNTRENYGFDKITGDSQLIIELKERVKLIPSSSTIMITGESGTGKEMFARAIHENGKRKEKPFVALNCAAIPETLLESELFGYERGSFTGADVKGKIGKVELANEGVLFLDEIGDMPLYLQAKLLRMLEERRVTKIGSTSSNPVDIQIISATNKKIHEMIETGMFREDLYYRLNVIPVDIPPLRERKGDIKLISMQFIDKYINLFGRKLYKIENKVWDYFENYNWPGNIRELQNVIEYLVSMISDDCVIKASALPVKILSYEEVHESDDNLNLISLEKRVIKKAVLLSKAKNRGNQFVADQLGIGIATLYRKMKKYDIN